MGLSIKTGIRAASLCIVFAASFVVFGGSANANAATFTVINTSDSGAGSLRQALISANAAAGADTINFNIPGTGVHMISLLSPFGGADGSQLGSGFPGTSSAHNPVTIDGCSQPGSDCSQFPLSLKVKVDASSISATADGGNGRGAIFNPLGSGSTVKGLAITGGIAKGYAAFAQYRVAVDGTFFATGGLTLQSNYIGLNPDGTANGNTSAMSAATNGIKIFPTKIGGSNPGEGNIIGSNSTNGVASQIATIFGTSPTLSSFVAEGNYFGLDPTGTQARPNGGPAIGVSTAYQDPTVGVPGVIIRNNKIANSGTYGIHLYMSGGVLVEGNQITNSGTAGILVTGKAPTRATPAPAIVQTPNVIQNNTITGTVAGPGVAVTDVNATLRPTRITIRHNSIYGNSGLGIDLGNNGVTANDHLDPDAGPNTLTNFPVLTQTAAGTLVEGSYDGLPNQVFTMDYYANQTADSSGYGEGQTWIGSMNFNTDANGHVTFGPTATTGTADNVGFTGASLHGSALDWLKVSGGAVPTGWSLASTATDGIGNTSEFSNSIASSGNSADSSGRTAFFRYRKQGASTWIATPTQPLNFPSSYDQNLTGLTQDTTYEYQLVVNGPAGEAAGSIGTFSTIADTDNDGVSNTIEDAAPNSGDANNDGIQDSVQMNVASFVNSVTGKYAVLELDPTCQINTVGMQAESSNATGDADYDYPVGLMNFKTICGGIVGFTTPVKQSYYGIQEDYIARKYNPNNKTYFNINGATVAKTSIGGQPLTSATFAVTEGSSLDMDQAANGVIVDPAGLALQTPGGSLAETGQPIWVYAALAGLMSVIGLGIVSQRIKSFKREVKKW
jgi:parallel beta-helix repeat protein